MVSASAGRGEPRGDAPPSQIGKLRPEGPQALLPRSTLGIRGEGREFRPGAGLAGSDSAREEAGPHSELGGGGRWASGGPQAWLDPGIHRVCNGPSLHPFLCTGFVFKRNLPAGRASFSVAPPGVLDRVVLALA